MSSSAAPANGFVASGVLSADGRYVVFTSSATNLVTGVAGLHVYRHDRSSGVTALVDVATNGTTSLGPAFQPSVSANGRYVVFTSQAPDLVDGDTNLVQDVFVRDMQLGTTALVSASSAGVPGDQLSGLSGLSGAHEISDDGRYVVFLSSATNLAAGANGKLHVYVKDMTTGDVVRASVNNAVPAEPADANSTTPAISGNGLVVAFGSGATNLGASNTAQVWVRDLVAGVTTLETPGAAAVGIVSTVPVLSFDGRYLAFVTQAHLEPADADNGNPDVFLRDRVAGTTVLASASPNLFSGVPTGAPSISGDGRWVAYNSLDDMLVTGDLGGLTDVFVYDRDTRAITLVSRNDAGDQANQSSFAPSLSGDGHFVLFGTTASNLVASPASTGNQLYARNLSENQAPVVNGGPDETVNEGTWLKRVGTFTDLDSSTSWTGTAGWGTGSIALIVDPDKKLWLFQTPPLVPGTYVVTISLTDDAGATGLATFRHTVTNVAPSVTGLGGDEFLYFGSTLHRQVSLGDPGMNWPVPQPAETYSATVDYGDGTGVTALSGTSFSLDHTYANPGTYVLAFTAADSNGGTTNAGLTVHVLKDSFSWLSGDTFFVGRTMPVKFSVRGPDGSFILDDSVHVDVVDANGNSVAGEYYFGDQPSRSVMASGDSYHVNVDTKNLSQGAYWLRVRFNSPTLVGEFKLGTAGSGSATRPLKAAR